MVGAALLALLSGDYLVSLIHSWGHGLRPAIDAGASVAKLQQGIVEAAALGALLIATGWACRDAGRRTWAVPLAALLMVAQPLLLAWRTIPTVDRSELAEAPALARIGDRPGPSPSPRLARPALLFGDGELDASDRVSRAHDTLEGLIATRFGLASLRTAEIDPDARWARTWLASGHAGERLLDLYGAELSFLPGSAAVASGMPVVSRTGDERWAVVDNRHRRPRAFVAHRWQWHDDAQQARAALLSRATARGAEVDLGRVQLIGQGPMGAQDSVPSGQCTSRWPRAERVELECSADRAGFAVLLDRQAPGWSATVDGRPADIVSADVVARAVAVDAGHHEVIFSYATPGLRFALPTAMASWVLTLGLVAWMLWRRRGVVKE